MSLCLLHSWQVVFFHFFVCRPAASGDTKAPQLTNDSSKPAAAGNAKQRPMPRPIATKGGTAKEKAYLKSKKPPVVRAMQMHDTGARSKIKTPVKPAATKAVSVASKPAKPSSKQPAAIPTPAAAPAKKATLMASFPEFTDIPIPPAVPAQRVPPTPPPKLTVAPKSWQPAPPPPAVVLQFAAFPQPPPPKLVKQEKLGASWADELLHVHVNHWHTMHSHLPCRSKQAMLRGLRQGLV